MKTAVSIPDALFDQAERLARRAGKTRSQVYREALSEYLARRDDDTVRKALDQVADDVAGDPEAWSDEAARRALEQVEW